MLLIFEIDFQKYEFSSFKQLFFPNWDCFILASSVNPLTIKQVKLIFGFIDFASFHYETLPNKKIYRKNKSSSTHKQSP